MYQPGYRLYSTRLGQFRVYEITAAALKKVPSKHKLLFIVPFFITALKGEFTNYDIVILNDAPR